jgi:hypothetical protein
MTRQELERLIRERAPAFGVHPEIALSVWEQESDRSTNLSKRGPVIPEGKWKGHYGRGPFQIMSFHPNVPDSLEGQVDWYLQHLKERGVEGYYGKGSVPGLPNMPTSAEYAQQVYQRAGIDPRTASLNDVGAPAVDPNTLPGRGLPPEMYMAQSMPPQTPLPPLLRNLMDSPGGEPPANGPGLLGAMGAGILSKMSNPILQGIGEGYMGYQQRQQDTRGQDLWAAQNQLALLKQYGFETPSPNDMARAREAPTVFVGPNGEQVLASYDSMTDSWSVGGRPGRHERDDTGGLPSGNQPGPVL